MSTDVAYVIRTGTTQRRGSRIFELLNMHLVGGRIVVVFHTKDRRSEQIIVIGEFCIPDGMDLLAPTNGFIGAQRVDGFE